MLIAFLISVSVLFFIGFILLITKINDGECPRIPRKIP